MTVADIDETVGLLRRELDATGLPVNLVLLSDHGMSRVDWQNPVVPGDYANLSDFVSIDEGPLQMCYHDDPARVDAAYEALATSGAPFRVYRREEVPGYLRFRDNARIGDIVVVSDPPVILTSNPGKRINPATHGFDPYRHREMHGIFYANGPAFRPGITVEALDAVHVYPLIAHLLGLKAPATDGRLGILRPVLR